MEAAVAPTAAENLPATQLVQTVEAFAAEYLPAPQSAQVEATLAPTTAENLPAAQSVQTVEAVPAAYFPAVQSVQTVEPVVRTQRQITSQIHMHMYICIEDVCVYVPIFIMYVCIIRMNECMHVYTHTHNDL